MKLTVQDVLKRPAFHDATVIAGKNGLHREVSWAHIVEISRFGHLLNGKEIIFTTGIGWDQNEQKSLSYVQQLIDYNAAALCVELVIHVRKLPDKVLHLAELNNFPIICFQKEVRFIDLIKDLHEIVIGYHESNWWRLENFHQKLQRSLTSNHSIGHFLKVTYEETKKQIVFYYENQFRFFPSPSKKRQNKFITKLNNDYYYSQQVQLFNQDVGTLYYLENKATITQFDGFALKRCSEILTQYIWRHKKQMEIENLAQNDWLLDAVYGRINDIEIEKKVKELFPQFSIHQHIIAIKPFRSSLLDKDREIHSETSSIILLRTILYTYGFQLITVKDKIKNNYILFIFHPFKENIMEQLEILFSEISEEGRYSSNNKALHLLSFGKVANHLTRLHESYETAIITLTYQRQKGKMDMPFYNHLTIYRIINQIQNKQELVDIVNENIGPLIEYDKQNNGDLTISLQLYLKNLGSVKQTAQDLHIVRQTLYHRLQKIEQLIGNDFLESEKRMMIELSLYTHNLLQKKPFIM